MRGNTRIIYYWVWRLPHSLSSGTGRLSYAISFGGSRIASARGQADYHTVLFCSEKPLVRGPCDEGFQGGKQGRKMIDSR